MFSPPGGCSLAVTVSSGFHRLPIWLTWAFVADGEGRRDSTICARGVANGQGPELPDKPDAMASSQGACRPLLSSKFGHSPSPTCPASSPPGSEPQDAFKVARIAHRLTKARSSARWRRRKESSGGGVARSSDAQQGLAGHSGSGETRRRTRRSGRRSSRRRPALRSVLEIRLRVSFGRGAKLRGGR